MQILVALFKKKNKGKHRLPCSKETLSIAKLILQGRYAPRRVRAPHEFESISGPRLLSGLPFMVMKRKSWLLGDVSRMVLLFDGQACVI